MGAGGFREVLVEKNAGCAMWHEERTEGLRVIGCGPIRGVWW